LGIRDTTSARPHLLRRIALRLLRWALALAGLALALVIVFRWVPVPISSMMLQRQAAALFDRDAPPLRHHWRPLERISPQLALAVIAAEDQNFPDHWGFDLDAIGRAVRHNNRHRRVHGASTISQQVAKNLFLWPGRNWLRKGLEAGLTLMIEATWPKRRILEVYLNIAQFGDGVYGAEAGARLLGTTAARLTRPQAARLAAVLPSPLYYSARRPSPFVARRAGWIEWQMSALGGVEMLRELER
jgi:monofunctional biosynthetic peptidoglycan transglycosylase